MKLSVKRWEGGEGVIYRVRGQPAILRGLMRLILHKNLKIGVDGGWWVGDRKTQDNQRMDRWLLARSTYLWGRDKNFDSWKREDMTLSFCWLLKTVSRRSFFPRFFHIQTMSDLTSSTWKRLTFKAHTHLHVRRGVRWMFSRIMRLILQVLKGLIIDTLRTFFEFDFKFQIRTLFSLLRTCTRAASSNPLSWLSVLWSIPFNQSIRSILYTALAFNWNEQYV